MKNRWLLPLLSLAILGASGALGFLMAMPQERYTEFYLLGPEGKAEGYPVAFEMDTKAVNAGQKGVVVSVSYERPAYVDRQQNTQVELRTVAVQLAKVRVGIVNQEHSEANYEVVLQINGERVPLWLGSEAVNSLGPVTLAHGKTYEAEVSFAPKAVGSRQKVEFALLKEGKPYRDTYLLVDVKQL